MSEEVDTRITPSLHPLNIRELEDYGDDTAPYLGQSETALSTAYLGFQDIHAAREAAAKDPTLNPAAQAIKTDDYARRVFGKITQSFDSASANLDRTITALEQQLTAPIESKASHGISAEIRAFVKGLDTGERMSFLQKAIERGDIQSASSVLGAPAYLSGLDADMQATFVRLYHERMSPREAKQVRAMKAAKALIEDRGPLLFKELEKSVGMPLARVHALRAAKTESERAFVLRDGN